MSIIVKIKRNRFVRGSYYLFRQTFGYPKRKFGYFGEDVAINSPNFISHPQNVYLMGDNQIGNANILTKNAKFIMKPHSSCGSGLKVATGNHVRIEGRFFRSITEAEKPAGYDKDVVVETDAWVGMNVTLLAGVTVGRGATVGTGAVVTKDIPPYCVAVGSPAKPVKFYWTIDQIIEHEKQLYPEEERYSREQLESIFAQYSKK